MMPTRKHYAIHMAFGVSKGQPRPWSEHIYGQNPEVRSIENYDPDQTQTRAQARPLHLVEGALWAGGKYPVGGLPSARDTAAHKINLAISRVSYETLCMLLKK